MTITRDQVRWGEYKEFSGPMWAGKHRVSIPLTAPFERIAVKVVSASEGGFDAAQLYDMCVFTGGSQQWCSLFPNLVKMLVFVEKECPGSIDGLRAYLASIGAGIDNSGLWFTLRGSPVNSNELRRELFMAGGTGLRNQWTEAQKDRAYEWVLAFANLPWDDAAVADAQLEFASKTIMGYVTSDAKWLFDGQTEDGWVLSLRAAYLSFAANNPQRAARYLKRGVDSTDLIQWTPAWVCEILRALVWDPGVDIHPHRYNAIRPVLEKAFDVDLPDFAEELRSATKKGQAPLSPRDIQEILLRLGYDIGPKGVDGHIGSKTTTAIREFQTSNGLVSDGVVGPKTRAKLLEFSQLFLKVGAHPNERS